MEMAAIPVAELNVDGGGVPDFMLGNMPRAAKRLNCFATWFDRQQKRE